MGNIWSFFLQTLTASEAAVLLLVVKAMFRDKLTPRWQFSAWGVLALVLLVPAGLGRQYALVNWPLLVEFVRTLCTGERTLTQVSAPIPIPPLAVPKTGAAWWCCCADMASPISGCGGRFAGECPPLRPGRRRWPRWRNAII